MVGLQETRTSLRSPGACVQVCESDLCDGLYFAELCIYIEHNILQSSPKTQPSKCLKNTGLKMKLD